MDTNSFKNALNDLDALKDKALSVQQDIDSSKKDSLDLTDSLGQKEVDLVTKYASQAASAKKSSLKDADSTSEQSAKKFVSDWADAFQQASNAANHFGDTTSGLFGAGLAATSSSSSAAGSIASGLLGGILGAGIGGSGLFGGFFADGGRPDTGKVSLVGEQGPELFVPDSAGTVVPNKQLQQGSGQVVVYQNFTFQSLDPATNMKLLQAQKDQIQSWVADGIKTNQGGLRSAVQAV